MKKKNMFLAGILALGLVFTLVLTGCPEEEGEDPVYEISNDFIGSWREDHANPYVLEITANELTFKLDASSEKWYTIEYTEDWTPLTSTDSTYSSGYKIVGEVVAKGSDTLSAWKPEATGNSQGVGDSTQATMGTEIAVYYYISTDKQTLVGGDPVGIETERVIYLKKADHDEKYAE